MTHKPFGVEELNIVGSAGTALIESVADLHIRVGGGCTVGIGTSIFNIQDGTADAGNDSVLNVGIVTANEYYGTFKGNIDPGTSTITIASSLTDVIDKDTDLNRLFPKDAGADKVVFWDDSETKLTYLNIGTNLSITDTTINADNVSIAVKQYSDNSDPRTERTCSNPIDVTGQTIGIGTTSNAYGNKYIQSTEPATSCEGDIWYDTTSAGGGAGTSGTIPIGGIIMWSGTIANIPTNWALCDGNNGTPNLLGRFIIPADIDHDFGSGDVAATTITSGATVTGGSADAVVVSHYHGYQARSLGSVHSFGDSDQSRPTNSTTSTLTTNAYDSTGSTVIGVDGTYKNLPPYYALAYIMRLS